MLIQRFQQDSGDETRVEYVTKWIKYKKTEVL